MTSTKVWRLQSEHSCPAVTINFFYILQETSEKFSDCNPMLLLLCWGFNKEFNLYLQGEILVLHHPTTISTKYQAMVHVGSVRQTASIIAMDKECLRTGDKAIVHFRFIKHPEYLKNGLKMVAMPGVLFCSE